MADPSVLTDRYARTIDRLSTTARTNLLRMWDSLESWTEVDAAAFRAVAMPYTRAAAMAAVDTANAYAETIAPGATAAPSDLIAADASARLYDPFDRYAHLLANGTDWAEALASARSVAGSVGRDAVYRTARQTLAESIVGVQWQRRVTGKSCDWCLSRSGIIWDTAADATFGHDNCDCLPVPAAAIGAHNERILAERGHNGEQVKARRVAAKARRSIQSQADTARRRAADARRQIATEHDPARIDRLKGRAHDWDIRAARADERLALAA